ncbi:MAG: DUF3659 domain-containing protein [Lachnospiraceae bacterium]|nr:DUF3659 domain-containing protein [Lachnospiraceae bacterium]
MNRKKWIGIGILACFMGLTGCKNQTPGRDKIVIQQTENLESAGDQESAGSSTGTGFKPPAGSRLDKNGNIVDKQGNTFDKEGSWQVPEGGHVDSAGRIIDKDGKVMGGGAKIGSKG